MFFFLSRCSAASASTDRLFTMCLITQRQTSNHILHNHNMKNMLKFNRLNMTSMSKHSNNTLCNARTKCLRWKIKWSRFKNDVTNANASRSSLMRQPIRSFRSKREVKESEMQTNDQLMKKHLYPSNSLIKHFLFTAGIFGSTFLAAFIYNYEKWQDIIIKLNKGTFNHEDYIGKKIDKTKFEDLKQEGLFEYLEGKCMQLTNGHKLILGIMALNLCVYGLWRVPSMLPMMTKNFSSSLNHPVHVIK